MIYLDSNVFITAALYEDEVGDNSRRIIKEIRLGNYEASTSTLTFDEVFWIVKREKDSENALRIVRSMLKMKNLRFISVDKSILWKTYEILDGKNLGPRDSIHLACAIESGSESIISEDSDFKDIDSIECITINDFVKRPSEEE